VALAVEAIIAKEIALGVSAAPDDESLVERWLNKTNAICDHFVLIDHLS
jgi:saccharopine dehydrogenase (NADP+, L-glutamate forming)